MNLGVRLKINLSKLDKSAFYEGKAGKWLDATVFLDPDNVDQYGNNGGIQQDLPAPRRERGERGEYIGNCRVFWTGESQPQQPKDFAPDAKAQAPADFDDSDIPF